MAKSVPVLLTYRFHVTSVKWLNDTYGFSEVTGLEEESEVIEVVFGNSAGSLPSKEPGRQVTSEVELKRPISPINTTSAATSAAAFQKWRNAVKSGVSGYKEDVTVDVYSEDTSEANADSIPDNAPSERWLVKQAFPTKLVVDTLSAGGSEVLMETITLQHSGCERVDSDGKSLGYS